MSKTVIIIAGPTAAGKTAKAIEIATSYNTKIISADSRQCYREMNIGVAKPSAEELAAVQHYFIDSHSIHQPANAAIFESYALNAANEIFSEHDVAVMVGGTGLYIKAFCEGLDKIPAIDPGVDKDVNKTFLAEGISWLVSELRRLDPGFFKSDDRGENSNPHRLMRALGVYLTTGQSIRDFQTQQKTSRDFQVRKIGLAPEKENLHRNINTRVDQMVTAGLVEEVKSLLPVQHLVPLQTVGYSELFEYFNGEVSLDTAIENIKVHTRQYAKRQMTWFRKDPSFEWIVS